MCQASLGPSMLIAIFTSEHAGVRNAINEWLNILQSIQLPFAIIPVLTFTSSRFVMGPFANRGSGLLLAILLTCIVLIANVYLVLQFIETHPTIGLWIDIVSIVLGLCYFGFVFHLLQYAYHHIKNSDNQWKYQQQHHLIPSNDDRLNGEGAGIIKEETVENGITSTAAAAAQEGFGNVVTNQERLGIQGLDAVNAAYGSLQPE